ncbi:MAG TPA: sterol desaturase family protein [Pseudonocardia sp.]|nr:sterol desaturase family protein [Pseudonocardia sp.]
MAAAVVTIAAAVAGIVDRPELVVGFLVCAAVFIPLEQLVPLVPRAGLRRTAWVDIAHAFGNRLPITFGTGVLLAWLAPVARAAVPDGVRAVVLAWPVWVQFVVLLLLSDLANYAAHRALHEVPVLWRLHSVHHSSPELDWLSTSRGHPLDQIVNVTALTLPLYALGASVSFSVVFLAFTFFYPFLAHANTRITLRPLSPVFVTPAFHHWHHAHEPEAVNKNYGAIFSFWDRIFGSWYLPDRMPSAYGIDEDVPETWVGQLAHPFRRRPRRAAAEPVAPLPDTRAVGGPWVLDIDGTRVSIGPEGVTFQAPGGEGRGSLALVPHPVDPGLLVLGGRAARSADARGGAWIALMPEGARLDRESGEIVGTVPVGAPLRPVRVATREPALVCSPALRGDAGPGGAFPSWRPPVPAAGPAPVLAVGPAPA